MWLIFFLLWLGGDLERARDAQDRAALENMARQAAAEAQKQPNDAAAQYKLALAESYVAEVAIEQRDKNQAHGAAEAGIEAARRAASMKPDDAEYHRILGTLCGQAVSSAGLQGLKYGRCAQEEVNKAVQLDPRSAMNYLSRGVGNYYLPPALGGGIQLAEKDFQKAMDLDPKLAEAHLWMGLALRKQNRNAEARKEFQRALELNPASAFTKEQLAKTPGS
ncbi:MAG TPA: tetratricopeptide repeat protein [Bryobacteraceae bacterium]|jgi:tetratricopeptide (TPR) repeat protein|nr:tetratricopeptide repeat protein [Bryobacteraceae bacterium]